MANSPRRLNESFEEEEWMALIASGKERSLARSDDEWAALVAQTSRSESPESRSSRSRSPVPKGRAPGRGHSWTPEEDEVLRTTKEKVPKVAEQLGLTVHQVRHRRQVLGLTSPKVKTNKAEAPAKAPVCTRPHVKPKPARHGQRWSHVDEAPLRRYMNGESTARQVAKELQRTIKAVKARPLALAFESGYRV